MPVAAPSYSQQPTNSERGFYRDTLALSGRVIAVDVGVASVEIDLRAANLIGRWVSLRVTNAAAGAEFGFFIVNENDASPPSPDLAARSGLGQCDSIPRDTTIRRFVGSPYTRLRIICSDAGGVVRVSEAQLG